MKKFYQATGFSELVSRAFKRVDANNFWLPVFADKSDALAFCKYVGGFARRVAPKAGTEATATFSDKHCGYIAKLAVEFAGWGVEEGIVLCSGNEVAGLVIAATNGQVVLPLKEYTHTIQTESNTLYVLYAGGTAFCRSRKHGAQKAADALYFAPSDTDATRVYNNGGTLRVQTAPQVGYIPIYLTTYQPIVNGTVTLSAQSFRQGMPIETIWIA